MKKTIIVHKKLCIRDSLITSIPCIVTSFLWIGIMIIGVEKIKLEFLNSEFYPLVIIIWFLVMLNLTKIVSTPVTTWSVEEEVK